MWFKKKSLPAKVVTPDPIQTKLDTTKVILDELVAQSAAGVTRGDYHDAILQSLILLHPEVKAQLPFVEFSVRLEKYLTEHPEQKKQ